MKKTVLLGVTGCVAAYKACEVVRGLQKAGLRVKVVMTKNATEFINPGQFRALTREPVAVGTFDDAPGDPIHHISLSKEADVFLIAPCTANVLGKIANGIADDLLTTTAMATTAPLILAPAMNVNMYENDATQQNMAILAERGVRIVDAGSGYLACGDVGKGRLADPADIVDAVLNVLEISRDMTGKRVVVTAGPTVEPIDAVRFISNPSSGKMGFALANALAEQGAEVELVTGPTALKIDHPHIHRTDVESAREMYAAATELFPRCCAAILSAAVADYRPESTADHKLKKNGNEGMTLTLVQNPDILATLGKMKTQEQKLIGFALETDNELANAKSKLERKNLDFIVLNSLRDKGAGFGVDTNRVTIIGKDGKELTTPLLSKQEVAEQIVRHCLVGVGK